MEFKTIEVESSKGVCTIMINRPKALNALNRTVLDELHRAILAFQESADDHVLVLAGSGEKAFVAGADIREMAEMGQEEATAFSEAGQAVMKLLALGKKISIAAVDGFALGGGCELAVACDIVIGSSSSRFGQPEIKLGVIPGFGGTQRLVRRVGEARARFLVLTGEMVKGPEAYAIGLIDRLVEPGEALQTAGKLAEKMVAEYSMDAVQSAKAVMESGKGATLEDALALEAKAFGRCFSTSDQKEGMSAFMAKRLPVFQHNSRDEEKSQ